jgi:DnaJ-class molecular chaperone
MKDLWLKVQLAHETLIDDTKRKKYDSSLPFDDSLPSKDDFKNEKEFYAEM